MKQKGKIGYIPSFVNDEIQNIKKDYDLMSNTEAFHKLIRDARQGRIQNSHNVPAIPHIPFDNNNKYKNKKRVSIFDVEF